MKPFVAALLACLLITPAWAINKCTGPDGKTVFQDMPCKGGGVTLEVRPASGNAPAPSAPSGQGEQKSSTEKINEMIATMRTNSRRQELEDRIIPGKRGAMRVNRENCDAELAALQQKKSLANNNLAGATWLQSIATEMGALTTKCDSRSRELQAELDAARQECLALGGCK